MTAAQSADDDRRDDARTTKRKPHYASAALISRVIQAARNAGVQVHRVTAAPDGSVTVVEEVNSKPVAAIKPDTDLDEELAAWEVQNGLARGS